MHSVALKVLAEIEFFGALAVGQLEATTKLIPEHFQFGKVLSDHLISLVC